MSTNVVTSPTPSNVKDIIDPYDYQAKVLSSNSKYRALFAGRRTGKTEMLIATGIIVAVTGGTVAYVAPRLELAHHAASRVMSIVDNHPHITCHKLTKTEVKIGQGKVRFTSASSDFKGMRFHPDVILIDEFTQLRREKLKHMDFEEASMVMCAGTPSTKVPKMMELYDWDVYYASSRDCPKMETKHLVEMRRNMRTNNYMREMMDSLFMGDHAMVPIESDVATVYKCIACGEKEEVLEDAPGEAHKYAIGKFTTTECL